MSDRRCEAASQLTDHFKFTRRPDWSYSPSVGGFNPDAQYKAPLIRVQADRTAFGIVPDVTVLRREELKRCAHSLDLDVPGGPILGVGFMPARMTRHSVYGLDTNRGWCDYEAFWSCSPRKVQLDERTQQWPTNNLALTQTVEAYLLAHRITGKARYLAAGEALLDYLLLFQQCWTHPGLENLSSRARLLGGFTTQNSDAEWSDARQSQCGNILLDYYRATGKTEYLERSVAALRAQFPVSPSENWVHSGYGAKAGVSSFHWGTGSGLAGIEIEEDYLHDAIVDVAAGRGVGVNGLNLTECSVRGAQIRFRLASPFVWKRPPVVVFRHTKPTRRYRIQVNEVEVGTWRGAELEQGIPVPWEKAQ